MPVNNLPRRAIAMTIALLLLLAPAALWLRAAGDLSSYFSGNAPPGQFTYVLAKLAGLYAGLLLWLQALYGLLGRTAELSRLARWRLSTHRITGLCVVLLAAAHAGLFVSAAGARTGQMDLSLLVPDFSHGYYRTALSLGAIAIWALPVAILAALLRRRLGSHWRLGHWLGLSSVSAMLVHALLVGSEARTLIAAPLYWAAGLSILLAIIVRMLQARRRRRPTTVQRDHA